MLLVLLNYAMRHYISSIAYRSSEGLYTASEAAEVAFAYVKAAGLDAPGTAPDNRTLLLNPTLCDALFKVGSLCAAKCLCVCAKHLRTPGNDAAERHAVRRALQGGCALRRVVSARTRYRCRHAHVQ